METHTITSDQPKHRMEIPARILADIEIMFEKCTDANMKAFVQFKRTLLEEEMYIMLKQLHELEEVYGIDIPTIPPVNA
jgi:hypothetical protein